MSVDRFVNHLATLINDIKDTRGVAETGIYANGQVTTATGTYNAVLAVPLNLYEGRQVWVQVSADKVAVIIGA